MDVGRHWCRHGGTKQWNENVSSTSGACLTEPAVSKLLPILSRARLTEPAVSKLLSILSRACLTEPAVSKLLPILSCARLTEPAVSKLLPILSQVCRGKYTLFPWSKHERAQSAYIVCVYMCVCVCATVITFLITLSRSVPC